MPVPVTTTCMVEVPGGVDKANCGTAPLLPPQAVIIPTPPNSNKSSNRCCARKDSLRLRPVIAASIQPGIQKTVASMGRFPGRLPGCWPGARGRQEFSASVFV